MRYREYMLRASRLDRLIQEQTQYRQLVNNLTNQWMTYASHEDTGIVYDLDIIKKKLDKTTKEIKELTDYLDES